MSFIYLYDLLTYTYCAGGQVCCGTLD